MNGQTKALAKCPFCGSENAAPYAVKSCHSVLCVACGGEGPEQDSESAAIAAWNRRPAVQAVPPWIPVTERMPEPGTECLVWKTASYWKEPFLALDRWDEQHECPVSFSTATVPIGLGWDSSDFEEVTHWVAIKPPPTDPVQRPGDHLQRGQA
jgi:Lar family restriction alleviation protein